MIEFPKLKDNVAKDSPLLEKKIVVGSCKLTDSKLEKAVNYDIVLQVNVE